MILHPIRRFIGNWAEKLDTRLKLWHQRKYEIAQFEDIRLSDLAYVGPQFETVMLGALQLIKDTDPRRFSRVKRHLRWVVNGPLPQPGAEYAHKAQTCVIDFEKPESESDYPYWIAWHASMLIHEATHGLIDARGIRYSPELRVRIERLCVTEQKRFVRRLANSQPDLADQLHPEFDETDWHQTWSSTKIGRFIATLRRVRTGRHK